MILRKLFLGFLVSFIFLTNGNYLPITFAASDSENFVPGQTSNNDENGSTKPAFSPPDSTPLDASMRESDIRIQVLKIINYVLGFVGLVSIIALIYFGFMWITAGGDEGQFTKGRKGILYTGAGILLILLSFSLVNFVINSTSDIEQNTDKGGYEDLTQSHDENQPDDKDPSSDKDPNSDNSDNDDNQNSGNSNNGNVNNQNSGNTFSGDNVGDSRTQEQSGSQNYQDITEKIEKETEETIEKIIEETIENIENFSENQKNIDDDKEDIDQEIFQKTIKNIQKLKEEIAEIAENFSSDSGIFEEIQTLATKINDIENNTEIFSDPDKIMEQEEIIKSLQEEIEETIEEITNLPKMNAVILAAPATGSAPLTVSFSGLESSDPSNTTVADQNFSWSFVDNDGRNNDLGIGPLKVYTFENPGSFVVKLNIKTASDQDVLPDDAYFIVRVLPPETKANFLIENEIVGTLKNVSFRQAQNGIDFDPKNSTSSPGAKIIEYLWDFSGGDLESFSEPKTVRRNFIKVGKNHIKLTILDNTGKKSSKEVTLVVKSTMAVIDISSKLAQADEKIIFDATDSSFENQNIEEYYWKISGPEGFSDFESSASRFSRSFKIPGEYNVELKIIDFAGNEMSTVDNFSIQSRPPVASFNFATKNDSEPSNIRFDATSSYDPENEKLFFSWDFDGDGKLEVQKSENPVAFFKFSEARFFRPKLIVEDAIGEKDETVRDLEIVSTLNIDFTANRFVAQRGTEIVFNAISKDAISFHWDFGDDMTEVADQKVIRHTFGEEGKYQVKLTVFNSQDESNTVEKTIFIGDGESPVPIFKVFLDNELVLPQKNLCGSGQDGILMTREKSLRIDASDSINVDGGKSNLDFFWNFYDGTFQTGKTVQKKFSEISNQGKCQKISMVIKDKTTGKTKNSDNIFVLIKNSPPIFSKFSVLNLEKECVAPCYASLQIEGARDLDGHISQYRWWAYREGDNEKMDLHTTSEPKTMLTLYSRGLENTKNTFFFVAEILDNDGTIINSEKFSGKSTGITVKNPENPPPNVDFIADRVLINEGEDINFNAEVIDPTGEEIPNNAYFWDFDGDGNIDDNSSGKSVSWNFKEAGEYEVLLKVKIRGISASKTRKVFVQRKKELPFAEFSENHSGFLILFDAGGSKFDSQIPENGLEYFWDFDIKTDSDGNGIPDDDKDASGVRVKNIFTKAGNYTVQLLVKDNLGKTDILQREIKIEKSGSLSSEESSSIRNIQLLSNAPMASLELAISEKNTSGRKPVSVFAFAIDGDGQTFSGPIEFKILKGDADVFPYKTNVVDGEAFTKITPGENFGKIIIQAKISTVFGELTENISFSSVP